MTKLSGLYLTFCCFCLTIAFAHDETERVYLSLENNQIIARDYQGEPIRLFATVFRDELEWDERAIYQHLNDEAIPVDAQNIALLIDGKPNEAYNVNDYAWASYANSATLSVAPSPDASLDNLNISIRLTGKVRAWNGESFSDSSTDLEVATWHWTNVADDGISDIHDERYFPDGGWYAYPINPVSATSSSPVDAGAYVFSPDDHYHWLFSIAETAPDTVYLIELTFATATSKDSEPFYVLIHKTLNTADNTILEAAKAYMTKQLN